MKMNIPLTCAALIALSPIAAPPAFADGSGISGALTLLGTLVTGQPAAAPSSPGQPNQSCGSATSPNTPGQAASAPGSAFNPSGTAGTVYAGQQPQNSRNPNSVSQYDVACFEQPAF